jgi:hypothetical protein
MKTEDLCIFLTSYTLTVAFAAVAEFLRRRDTTWLIAAGVALGAVCAATIVGFYLEPGTSYTSIVCLLIKNRDFSSVVSLGMGVAAALVWVAQLPDQFLRSRASLTRRLVQQSLLAASIGGVVLGGQAFIWMNLLGITRDPPAQIYAPEFIIEKIADLDYPPLRVAASDADTLYVSYDYFETWGAMGGAIVQLSRDSASGQFKTSIVADSPLLMRSYGLAIREGDLFVSRTGISSKATMGKVSYNSTGAVTRLKDMDNDGYFEYAHDVVSGLPGARGPDTMQQNNGISFAADGSLFVTSATAADRALDEHPWGGAVLRFSPDFRRSEVYAKGFRNPFGIVIGPDDEVFVTDNDVDESPGDELNHVVQGGHYGHPYVVPNEASVEAHGFREPILLGEHESNLLGLAYATSRSLPAEYRNCLYVTDFMKDAVLRLTLVQTGDTYKVTGVHTFASVPTPVDITVTPSGDFFVISRKAQNVYRISPRKTAAGRDRG